MTIHDLIPILAAVLAAVATGGAIWRLSLGRTKQEPAPPKSLPDPKHTAEEHANAQADETPDAIDAAAAEHGADPDDVASDLAWADDVRGSE